MYIKRSLLLLVSSFYFVSPSEAMQADPAALSRQNIIKTYINNRPNGTFEIKGDQILNRTNTNNPFSNLSTALDIADRASRSSDFTPPQRDAILIVKDYVRTYITKVHSNPHDPIKELPATPEKSDQTQFHQQEKALLLMGTDAWKGVAQLAALNGIEFPALRAKLHDAIEYSYSIYTNPHSPSKPDLIKHHKTIAQALKKEERKRHRLTSSNQPSKARRLEFPHPDEMQAPLNAQPEPKLQVQSKMYHFFRAGPVIAPASVPAPAPAPALKPKTKITDFFTKTPNS